jgi:hypothetical protein
VLREVMSKGFAFWESVFWEVMFCELVFWEVKFWAVDFLGNFVRFLGS